MLNAWQVAREKAEETGKDVVAYVIGDRILTRVRSVNSKKFC